jgi:hypothetical protein
MVLPHKQAIEERIAGVGQSLFGQSYRYLLYDLTSTYFEGQMESNPKALRGYSRDHWPDCKQVTIGGVVDREGYPVGYEVLAGNMRDHKTVAGMLQRLGARFGPADRTLCKDRGMVTQDSLKLDSGVQGPLCPGGSPGRVRAISGASAAWTVADQTHRPGH